MSTSCGCNLTLYGIVDFGGGRSERVSVNVFLSVSVFDDSLDLEILEIFTDDLWLRNDHLQYISMMSTVAYWHSPSGFNKYVTKYLTIA